MADSIAEFINALDRVPEVLLNVDDARVLRDARTSAGVLESLEGLPIAVVVVGATGVGKSHLVNELVGLAASEADVLRPTTTTIVMAGSHGPVAVDYASEYVLAPDAPVGVAIVDTPAPETDTAAVRASLAAADIGILVVSLSRYSDAATHELWSSMEAILPRAVVLNRLRGSEAERTAVAESARERFTTATVIEMQEGGDADDVRRFIVEQSADRRSSNEKISIARSAAAGAGRHMAGSLTASAIILGSLADALDEVTIPEIAGEGLPVLESWLATERALVESVTGAVKELDRRIVESVAGGLGKRIATSLGSWESGPLEARLADWRVEAADDFRAKASIRWRRSSAEQLLDKASWRVGVNLTVQVVKRVKRLMGSTFEQVSADVHDSLVSGLNDAIEDRRSLWRAALDRAGSFKPGELAAAADALGNQ